MSIHPKAHQAVDSVVADLSRQTSAYLEQAHAIAAADPVEAAALRACAFAIRMQIGEVRQAGARMIAKQSEVLS